MRLNASQGWAIVGLASLVWLALSIVGVMSGGGLGVVLSLRDVIPALLAGFAFYERWGWRWHVLHELRVVTTPVVIGTWRGELMSDWTTESGTTLDPIPVYLAVSQTLTTVSVHLLSSESSSVPVAGGIARTETGFPAIGYLFRNRPAIGLRHDRSRMHYGGTFIEIVGDPATGLNGEYWTERKTTGSFTMREHSPAIAQTHEDATKLRLGPPTPVGVVDGLKRILAARYRMP